MKIPFKGLPEKIKPFAQHGVIFEKIKDNQAIGTCPFTNREGKFYVNTTSQLWDSKTAGVSGNLFKFLELISKENEGRLGGKVLSNIIKNRGLPAEAFKPFGIGFNGRNYTIPIRNEKEIVQDIRCYKLGSKTISTSGCRSGLLNSDKLSKAGKATPIFVCEGEWDAIALQWLLTKVNANGIVVSVPGAGVFKNDWIHLFEGRRVFSLYDNDEAGENGEELLLKRIGTAVSEIKFCRWLESLPDGFDVRDFIVEGAVKQRKPKNTWKNLKLLFTSSPRKGQSPLRKNEEKGESKKVVSKKRKKASLQDVINIFNKWLYLENTYGIEVALSVAVSNRLQGDPLWLFLVSPPGGAKTETILSLEKLDETYSTSSLTTHSLISGATWKGNNDPSLIPKLDGKLLAIKDFTSILSKRDSERDEIFGILRDAYDGKCGKVFGNGIVRNYKSKFSILAAVTPHIYQLSIQHQSLGERFLKFITGSNLQHHSEKDVITRAIGNIDHEINMREELSEVVYNFVNSIDTKILPKIPPSYLSRIVSLSQFCARLRGTIIREQFRPEIITSKPSAEVGSRVGKQLAKLGLSLALIHGRKEITDYEYMLLKKTALDTIPQRNEDIVRLLFTKCPTINDALRTREIVYLSRYPSATVSRLLNDMNILEIVTRVGPANSYKWTLSEYIRDLIKKSELYTSEIELDRPKVKKTLRIRKKKK